MSRAHRVIVTVSTVAWTVSIALMFTPFMHPTPHVASFLRVASVNVGALAACMTTVAVMPYMFAASVTDGIGLYLAGWAAAQEQQDEPTEPTRLRSVS